MTGAEDRVADTRGPVLVLAAQGFALGLTVAWVTIAASAIFLATYGAELLPMTYVGAAVGGIAASAGLAAAFRRRALVSVAATVLAGLTISLAASWGVLSTWDADWVSFGLLALVPLMVPVGFIFVVGQAGMLLDVRALKLSYAKVVAGFALGFVAGGLAGPPLLSVLGPTRNLLAVAAVSAAAFFGLVVLTGRRYPTELAVVDDASGERPTLRALSRNRYVLLIVAFQMLSAVESQWLDFNVLATAAQRYQDSDALARFVSQFSAIAYGTDILFLLVIAGFLLRRFGLRYGLTANAIGVALVLGAILVATPLAGSGTTIVFALVVTARVADLTLSDGTSRTSLSAAYQAVPNRLRPVTQATVEGLAVPVAIGASGIVLLVVPSAGGADDPLLPLLTLLVVVAWIAVAVLLYRHYRVNLLANLRGRMLDGAELTIEEEGVHFALDQLLESPDPRDVRLGLDILTSGDHPELRMHLQRLILDDRPTIRVDALERLQHTDASAAVAGARRALHDAAPGVRAAALRVLGAIGDGTDLRAITVQWDCDVPEVRVAAAGALTRLGDDAVCAGVGAEISRLGRSTSPNDREFAAALLGGIATGCPVDRAELGSLLDDPDARVVNEALNALRAPEDTGLVTQIPRCLDDRRTASAALDALVRMGNAALVVVDGGLRSARRSPLHQELLVHATREIGGREAIALLGEHIEHRDRDVGLAVMRGLAALGSEDSSNGPPGPIDVSPLDVAESVVHKELVYAAHALRALVAFEREPAASVLRRALQDELALIRARVLAAFSMRHGTAGFAQAVFQLAQRDPHSHALALEWLDVTLVGVERSAVALLDPSLSDRDRLSALGRTFAIPAASPSEMLLEVMEDRAGPWRRPWVKACALHAAAGWSTSEFEVLAAVGGAQVGAEGVTEADDVVLETLVRIRDRRRDLV